jgi:phi13 family phage major tail protein
MAIKGLRGFRFVELTNDEETGTTYATEITKLIGARNIDMKPVLAEGELYGDDQVLESESALTAIDVTIDMTGLPLSTRAKLTGQKFENGVLKENKDAEAPNIAFGFIAPKSVGEFRYVWLLKGKMKPLEDSAKTREDKIEYQTPTANLRFIPRISDGYIRFIADTDDDPAITETQFFTTAFLKNGTVAA